MKKIIDGKRYDTGTATEVAYVGNGETVPQGNWEWDDTSLYRTPRGGWFVAGSGGPNSQWAVYSGEGGSRSGGSGLRPVTAAEALELLEAAGATDAIEEYFEVVDA